MAPVAQGQGFVFTLPDGTLGINLNGLVAANGNTIGTGGGLGGFTGSVGDLVWFDVNGDGIQDPGEPGIAGVQMSIAGDSNGDGVIDVSLTTVTDVDGFYRFDLLPLGVDYEVSVDPVNFDPGGPLEAFAASPSLQGPDPALDSDGSPALTTIVSGAEIDLDVDFGYACLCPLGTAGSAGAMTVSPLACPVPGVYPTGMTSTNAGGNPAGLSLCPAPPGGDDDEVDDDSDDADHATHPKKKHEKKHKKKKHKKKGHHGHKSKH